MKRSTTAVMSLAVSLAVAACSVPAGAPSQAPALGPARSQPTAADATATHPANGPTASAVLPISRTIVPAPPELATSEPTADGTEYRITYDWDVPWDQVTIPHAVQAPIAPAPALTLPYLVAVYAGDHQEATPKFQRISF